MSSFSSLAHFLGDRSFDAYRADVLRWFDGYVDVRTDGESLVFFTTEKAVWWAQGLEMTVAWPTHWEGEMEQCEAWEQMAQGKVHNYMGVWVEPYSAEHHATIERWKREARERGSRPPDDGGPA